MKTDMGVVKVHSNKKDVFFRDYLETNDISVYEWWNKVVPETIQTISV
jgi:hypothetical protein